MMALKVIHLLVTHSSSCSFCLFCSCSSSFCMLCSFLIRPSIQHWNFCRQPQVDILRGALEHVYDFPSAYYYYYYCIERRIYFNLSKSTQSAAGLKALKPAANSRYFMCKTLPYCFHLLYRSTFILLTAKCMLVFFRVSAIHRTPTWTTGPLTCVSDLSCAYAYTRGLGTLTASQHNIGKTQFFSCAPDGIRTYVLWILSPTKTKQCAIGCFHVMS